MRPARVVLATPEMTAQALPSCGCRVVVSLSRYKPAVESQRRVLAASLMAEEAFAQVGIWLVELRIWARVMVVSRVYARMEFAFFVGKNGVA